jgi:hypothetical protein
MKRNKCHNIAANLITKEICIIITIITITATTMTTTTIMIMMTITSTINIASITANMIFMTIIMNSAGIVTNISTWYSSRHFFLCNNQLFTINLCLNKHQFTMFFLSNNNHMWRRLRYKNNHRFRSLLRKLIKNL